jgi:hypothetical protein
VRLDGLFDRRLIVRLNRRALEAHAGVLMAPTHGAIRLELAFRRHRNFNLLAVPRTGGLLVRIAISLLLRLSTSAATILLPMP